MTQANLRNLALGLGALLVVLIGGLAALALAGGRGQPAEPSPTHIGQAPTPTAELSTAPAARPTSRPSDSPPATPGAQPNSTAQPTSAPTRSPSATASPLSQPSPTLPPSPAPSPAPTAPTRSVFQEVAGFPTPGEHVSQIVSAGPGFVAVGSAETSTANCSDFVEGRIWTSTDGRAWTRRDGGLLAGVRLNRVAAMGGAIYAFGYSGVEECAPPDDLGNNVWRSDDGLEWEQLTSGVGSPDDVWVDVASAGARLVVVGRPGWEDAQAGEHAGVWISMDGQSWRTADRPPRTYTLQRVAALGATLAAFGEDPADGLAWYSADGGETWRRGTIDAGYLPYSFSLTVAGGQFVAATTACCNVPQQTLAISYVSSDGRTWRPGSALAGSPGDGDTVVALANDFLTLTDGIGSRLSADGLSWFNGPAGPALDEEFGFTFAAAANTQSVVLIAYDRLADGFGARAWVAPASAFDTDESTQPAQPAERPALGRAYEYRLYTHCGSENMRVLLDGSVWTVERIESTGRGFRDPEDRGELTLLSENEARFDSRRGGSILFQRTASPPPWPRCA